MTITEWINSDIPLTNQMFEKYTSETRSLNPNEQLRFLKKAFEQIEKGTIYLTVQDINKIETFDIDTYIEFGKPESINYNLDIVIKLLTKANEFQRNKEHYNQHTLCNFIADFICKYLKENSDYLKTIELPIENCPGRTSIVRKSENESYIRLRGKNYKVYDLYQGYSILPETKYSSGGLKLHYRKGIFAKGIKCCIEITYFRENYNGEDKIKYGNCILYNDKKYKFEWLKDQNEYLIVPDVAPTKYCEGRKSQKPCNLSSQEFWWCYGKKCMKANQNATNQENWENYTLRDFFRILNIEVSEEVYYGFIGEINRMNRLIKRLNCKECNSILRPLNQSHFGFYRVSRFECTNQDCSSEKVEIYLTHCLNGRCNNIIDSRVAKKCPNGFIICDKCGSCCSNSQFHRRINNLQKTGNLIPNKTYELAKGKKGHLEELKCYCYSCQNLMTEDKYGNQKCDRCKIEYNLFNSFITSYKKRRSRTQIFYGEQE